jgi:hypothetical protein
MHANFLLQKNARTNEASAILNLEVYLYIYIIYIHKT